MKRGKCWHETIPSGAKVIVNEGGGNNLVSSKYVDENDGERHFICVGDEDSEGLIDGHEAWQPSFCSGLPCLVCLG
jgi:hypothetical protein